MAKGIIGKVLEVIFKLKMVERLAIVVTIVIGRVDVVQIILWIVGIVKLLMNLVAKSDLGVELVTQGLNIGGASNKLARVQTTIGVDR